MSDMPQQFYARMRMYNPAGRYWTIGLHFSANSFREAAAIIDAWSYGVRAVSLLNPLCDQISGHSDDYSYYPIQRWDLIYKELLMFIRDAEQGSEGKEKEKGKGKGKGKEEGSSS